MLAVLLMVLLVMMLSDRTLLIMMMMVVMMMMMLLAGWLAGWLLCKKLVGINASVPRPCTQHIALAAKEFHIAGRSAIDTSSSPPPPLWKTYDSYLPFFARLPLDVAFLP